VLGETKRGKGVRQTIKSAILLSKYISSRKQENLLGREKAQTCLETQAGSLCSVNWCKVTKSDIFMMQARLQSQNQTLYARV
jgi:hypothetical protein